MKCFPIPKKEFNNKVLLLIIPFLTFAISVVPISSSHAETFKVKRVIDGDTLLLANGEKVRLIGIDAPESRVNPRAGKQVEWEGKDLKTIISMGEESTKFAMGLVKPGDQVRIEFDVEKRDQYGRLLGYVFLSDGRMLNEEIVRAGYANLLTHPPNVKYQEGFSKAYREAREAKRGLWR